MRKSRILVKIKRRQERGQRTYYKNSNKIRNVYSPSLVGRYEIIICVRRYSKGDKEEIIAESQKELISTLHVLIPNRYKITYRTRNGKRLKTFPLPGYLTPVRSVIHNKKLGKNRRKQRIYSIGLLIDRIYLKHESDLFAVLFSFPNIAWRIKRVSEIKPKPSLMKIYSKRAKYIIREKQKIFKRAKKLFGFQGLQNPINLMDVLSSLIK